MPTHFPPRERPTTAPAGDLAELKREFVTLLGPGFHREAEAAARIVDDLWPLVERALTQERHQGSAKSPPSGASSRTPCSPLSSLDSAAAARPTHERSEDPMNDPITCTPLPYPEPTCRSVGEVLVEAGWAADLAEGERLAARLFPDLPPEITLED